MITAIILAAGKSQRMGTQKLLLPLGDRPVIARIVDEIVASPVDDVIVVIRTDQQAIEQALENRPVRFVQNPDADGDMLSSIRCGLKAAGQSDAFLITLGDQPSISRHVVTDLVEAFQAGRGRVTVPTFHGKRGHPLLVAASYREEILTTCDGVGLCRLLRAHPDDLCELEVPSPEVLENMNLPGHYQEILSRSGRKPT